MAGGATGVAPGAAFVVVCSNTGGFGIGAAAALALFAAAPSAAPAAALAAALALFAAALLLAVD